MDGVFFNKLIINHFGGTAALSAGPGGVDPTTLILRGTTNVAVVDASLIPTSVRAIRSARSWPSPIAPATSWPRDGPDLS